nr:hypothetical protein [uncultured Pedobacter sp.]
MLSMICFATGNPLIPFCFFTSFTNVADPNANVGRFNPKLIIDDIDFSTGLSELLSAMNALPEEKKPLVFSLLDRWRKACYLDVENEESFLYEDEALLACFHILEMLADEYKNVLDYDAEKSMHKTGKSKNNAII